MKSKTIKKDFYNLVLKVVMYTIVSTIITYVILLFVLCFKNRPTNYYVKYIDKVSLDIEKNGDSILKGNIIDLKKYSTKLKGEVIDLKGDHLYGDKDIMYKKFNLINSINKEQYYKNYIYRYIPITYNNSIKAVYVVKAPFDFMLNNINSNKRISIIYILALITPILYFILYLFLFTSKLYNNISKNVNILLHGTDKICSGDFDFYIDGTKGIEFRKIQKSFNTMIKVLKGNIDDLSKLDRERRMMVSSIAHDIRTPITVIKGQIEIIDDIKDCKDYNIDTNMNIINKNCDRMTTLTDNLALLYKVQGASFLLRHEKVNLYEILKDKELEIKTLGNKKNIKISFKIDLIKKEYISDTNLLFRVLDNILYNSLRFTNKGEIILQVHDDSQNIYFKCSDTGCGFKQKDTSKLFEAFYQDEDYKDHFGLGLYIAQKIVTNFNGKINAYNNTEYGSTVEFYIKELKDIG
ncbi:HAMP domain-containing histidine kinase [Clostridium botulinum]|uniref:histidine kinase n=1 Tax=Clostridium botulinum C/D str. DC5 TaxID=1443128 RepID=A0A0A0I6H3_CLOBO|nr:HAMP domain-containing sensor histidine kinase [Clostridium botulinum]KGM96457.1 histidine kinase [Clostridium botulinum C/D str. DC5]MCD3235467.1 HAMP domain-containing histidine kinase [Clostridium botulinum D/C]MCD3241399.1 HAMP domain-containing histidine kinase [Clostridium botulinum D/C]MCD3268875.1 HAMP domain-containing histidine kinase [Clostridium botulinum D/C]MCD3301206.1 HAMP domain-containing histidine kinase [Clostridium botulinum D/C]